MKYLPLFVLPFIVGACSSAPLVPVPPTVDVAQFDSVLITPEMIKFQGKIVIQNQMRGELTIEKVDWGADLHDKPVVDETFTQLHPMRSRGQQTVTFPFQIPMKTIVDQAVDVLAEEAVRVDFRGSVHPVGFESVPFAARRTIPIPNVPIVTISGFEGNPLQGEFTVHLSVKNTNDFPMTVASVKSFLDINGKKYSLMRAKGASEMGPGGMGQVSLTMKQSRGKSLSMALNALQTPSQPGRFTVGGEIRCRTPHGIILLPLELESK